MTYKFSEEQELWLRDLETTEEPQTTEFLHRLEDSSQGEDEETDDEPDLLVFAGYCCLGRACVVLGIPETKTAGYEAGFFGEGREDSHAPDEVVKRLRLRDKEGIFATPELTGWSSLVVMNDNGCTFSSIAAYIRANPENVFLPPEDAS